MFAITKYFSQHKFNYYSLSLIAVFLLTSVGCNSKFFSRTALHLASDSKTGKYIGVVKYEIRDFETKELLYYEVDTDEGIVRKSPQGIKIYEP